MQSSCDLGDGQEAAMAPEFHEQYSATNAAPGSARHHITAFLEEHGEAPLIPAAALLVSELVTNSVLHGGEPIDVHARLSGAVLRVDVNDTGNGHPQPGDPDLHGRGLRIVDDVSTAWGMAPHRSSGTTAWFELHSLSQPGS
jgi:anti-sigma regulatory factor (Ser/Thr protein kinase)